jgi:glycosyltransferase involved in cell wall biosynthesis
MTKISVALDARCLQDQPLGGVGRSTRALVDAVRDHVDLELLTDARKAPLDTDLPQRALRSRAGATKAAWLQLALPRALRGFDGIFHCPWYGLPFRQPVPMVVTIYDLTFEHGSSGFRPDQRVAYRVQARWAVRTAAHVLTGSTAVRDELCSRYGLDPARLTVQPSPLDPATATTDDAQVRALREHLSLPGRYVAAIGGAARRRLDRVFAAWPTILERVPDVQLLVLGEDADVLPPRAVASGLLDDSAWAAALAGADALVYPTEFEGFGYPALEAMALGTPVVYTPVGSLPEVVGDAGVRIDRHDAGAVAAGALQVLLDPALAARLTAAGRARARAAEQLEPLRECVLDAYTRAASARS